jgi:hypothetical protein
MPLYGESGLDKNKNVILASEYGILPNTGVDQTANVALAIAALPENGVLQFDVGTYIFNINNTKSNITINGAGMPTWNGGAFGAGVTVLEGGTIVIPAAVAGIQFQFTSCSRVKVSNLGIDQSTSIAGVTDGIIWSGTNSLMGYNELENIVVVGKGYAANSSTHAMEITNGFSPIVKNWKAYAFGHCLAIKATDAYIQDVMSYDCELSTLILKPDVLSVQDIVNTRVQGVRGYCSGDVAAATANISILSHITKYNIRNTHISDVVLDNAGIGASQNPISINQATASPTFAYSQTLTDVTVTLNGHGMTDGDTLNVVASSGGLDEGTYTVSNAATDTFHLTSRVSETTSGNFTHCGVVNTYLDNVRVMNSAANAAFHFLAGRYTFINDCHVMYQNGFGFYQLGSSGKIQLRGCTSIAHKAATATSGTFDIADVNGTYLKSIIVSQQHNYSNKGAAALLSFGDTAGAVRAYCSTNTAGYGYSSGFTVTGQGVCTFGHSTGAAKYGEETINVPVWSADINGLFTLKKMATASRPAWAAGLIGGMYFDTTLNKLVVAGASDWEVVTSV